MKTKKRVISFEELKEEINLVKIKGIKAYITKTSNNYFLISRTCPHMGGTIKKNGDDLFCPLHNWYFSTSGECKNSTQNAFSIPLNLEEGYLYADKKDFEKFEQKECNKYYEKSPKTPFSDLKDIPKLNLHSHATLELEFKNKNIIFDPWLNGPAMMGSWRQYPKPIVEGKDLDPDVIIITHEHSDHFHLPTLKAIGKNKLIIFPNFNNGRIRHFLEENNFQNFREVNFDEKFKLFPNTYVTFFRPQSIFLDSIVLLEKDSFRFLNLNDAGLNKDIERQVGSVHLVSCIFSTGASGYPLCWNQISNAEKKKIMIEACRGRLEMLIKSIEIYKADFILPFASHIKLWLEDHTKYRKEIINNNINDVFNYFKQEKKLKYLLPLIPGDSYELKKNSFFSRSYDPKKIYKKEYIEEQLLLDRKNFKGTLISWGYYNLTYDADKIVNHFVSELDSSSLKIKEEVYLIIKVYGSKKDKIIFLFKDGKFLKSQINNNKIPILKITILDKILMQIIEGNLSWDEARVGYWMEWWRNTPKVHNLLIRAMQGNNIKNYKKNYDSYKISLPNKIMPISEIIYKYPEANNIFKKFQMFCQGCALSPWETIDDAIIKHSLSKTEKIKLKKELEILMKNKS